MAKDEVCPECKYKISRTPDKKQSVTYLGVWHYEDCSLVVGYYERQAIDQLVEMMQSMAF